MTDACERASMRAMILLPVPTRPRALLVLLLACAALLLRSPAALTSPLPDEALVTLAQQTGGSFGGSRWGSGSSSSGSSGSSSSGSWGGSSSSGSYSGGSYSGGSSSHSSGSGDSVGGVLLFIEIVVWCFSVSPVLGFAVLGIGLAFLLFVFRMRS